MFRSRNQKRTLSSLFSVPALALLVWLQAAASFAQSTGAFREVYLNIGAGVTVADLTGAAKYPNTPDSTGYLTALEVLPIDQADNYGARVRAFVVPPTTGSYVFWIASDDASDLYLSTDETPQNKTRIAFVSTWSSSREWGKEGNQQSGSIALEAGRRYYLEALMKEGIGGDNLAMRWQLPNSTIEEPIPATVGSAIRLIPVRTNIVVVPQLLTQPTNQSVLEGTPASFGILASNQSPLVYEWRTNGVAVPGATKSVLTIASTSVALHNGRSITCVASNSSGAVTSSVATLTVTSDTFAPTLVSAINVDSNAVLLVYSESVEAASAGSAGNYQFSGGISVSSVTVVSATAVRLNLSSSLTFGTTYTITVNNVRDQATVPNTIAANAQIQFTASEFVPQGIGGATLGTISSVGGGLDISGTGSGIGGTLDQFQFAYQQRTGDFDLKVRVQGLTGADLWAKAGLMARASLDPNTPFAAALTTPQMAGAQFAWRDVTNGIANGNGYFPATIPNLLVRLKRAGAVFTGYASQDGVNWTQLGTATVNLPGTIYVGMALSSQSSSLSATAQLREFQTVTGGSVVASSFANEPLGASSRRTGLVISEIMYHPRPFGGSNATEFIEIYNTLPWSDDISGYRIAGDINYVFPPNTVIGAGKFIVVARYPALVQEAYGITGVLGPWNNNNLPNAGGTVRLRGRADEVLLHVEYTAQAPWPLSADGAGHSIVLARPSYGEASPKAWAASDVVGGSPGAMEPVNRSGPDVVINEWLAHTDDPVPDFVELFNRSAQSVDLSGYWLSDGSGALENDAVTNKFRIPDGTIILPRGFVSFNQNELGFSLSSGGERIFLANAGRTRVVDVVEFEGQQNGVSSGRVPDGSPYFAELAQPTAGTNNAARLWRDVVINELMHSPISGLDEDEFVELHNRGASAVNVGGWRFRAGIDYEIPAGTEIPANGFLVVAANAVRLRANYPNLNAGNCVGDYNGKLSGSGERVALYMPDQVLTTNVGGTVVTNTIWIAVSEVTYGEGGRWGNWADGGGSSLELKDPHSDVNQAANWADSDESAKGQWTNIELTGVIGEILGSPANDNLQIALLGIGECLVDDVELRVGAGANVLANPGFESGLTSWTPQGSHDSSMVEAGGFSGSQSLHLRAGSRGDNGGNRIRSAAFGAVSGTVTIRAKVKWLRGWPEILFRLHGGGFEAFGRMQIAANLGTPGAQNSRHVGNAGPAVFDVIHNPILPQTGDAVVVTARASDADGMTLRLKYRVDPSATYSTVTMLDNGTGGDAVAGDGLYSGTINAQNSGTTVAFYIEAVDGLNVTNTFPQQLFPTAPLTRLFPNDAVTRECVVRWGDVQMAGTFATYHLWVTAGNTARWQARDPLNNSSLDGTFVYNNYRVVYNSIPQYAGSPWHRGQMTQGPVGGNRVDYVMNFPDDDRMLGATDFVLNNPGNPGGTSTSDTAAQAEQAAYMLFKGINVHYNYRRYVHVFVNGSQRSTTSNRAGNFIFEDSQQPNSDVLDEWFDGDTDGELFKIEDWFEFNDNGYDFITNNDADLARRTTTINGVPNTVVIAPYRFMFRRRAVGAGDSANNYTSFNNLLDAVSPAANPSGSPITNLTAVDAVANLDQWMRIFAVQRTAVNWDSYGWERGKNAYMYKGKLGRFEQMTWDIDFTMGIDRDANQNIFANASDVRINAMLATPVYRRAFIRALKDIVNGPLRSAYADPILDAKAAALTANNVNVDSAMLTRIKSFIAARNTYLQGQLTTYAANFSVAGAQNQSSTNSLFAVTGIAPAEAATIRINGRLYPITWSFNTGQVPNGWSIPVALEPGTNTLVIQPYDLAGNPIAGMGATNTVNYTGPAVAAQGAVIINEIMYNPTATNAQYVEIFNRSTVAFDLSGWRINGLGYTFPSGTLMTPRQFMVIAKDRGAFTAAYGSTNAVFDVFPGTLDADGETLTLLKPTSPGVLPAGEEVVDQVRYENGAPWPAGAATNGASLQRVDITQRGNTPANWSDGSGWRYFTFTASSVSGSTFYLLPLSAGSVYVDDLVFVTGTVANAGVNLINNGDFEGPFSTNQGGPWVIGNWVTNSTISTTVKRSGNASLLLNSFGNVTVLGNALNQPVTLPSGTYTVSLWYLPVSMTSFRTRVNSAMNPAVPAAPGQPFSPTATNSVAAVLPALPAVWVNEVQAENLTGVTDNQGEREPWIELYNSSTNAVSLDGWSLANSYTNLAQWAFPTGTVIQPGQFLKVWADGETGESDANNLHTSFRLAAGSGSVALVAPINGGAVLDYLNYAGVPADASYGNCPDGQPFDRSVLTYVTPGTTNDCRSAPIVVKINEWVADNVSLLADPADNRFEDWFELYNPTTNTVNLAGYFLTDNLTNKTQFEIPSGYTIPPGGHLLVWADGAENQNSTNRADLHVSFSLSRNGEAIGLFAPDGSTIDSVVFGVQTTDIAQGRYPDGDANIQTVISTPRAANQVTGGGGNTAPVFGTLNDRSLVIGQSLNFALTATDSDVPAQALVYALNSGPNGANVAGGGQFTWTPTNGQAPSTNIIVVRVTDNGTPSMSATGSFTVVVALPPRIGGGGSTPPGVQNGQFSLGFETLPGHQYQVQYKNNLSDANWENLGSPQTAAGASLTVQDNLAGNPRRFYRVVQLD